MSLTPSTMLALGTPAPDFSLVNIDGKTVSLSDFSDSKALLVVFMCNHCPYVKHIADALSAFADEYREQGLAVVGISSNDADNYPDDGPEKMAEEARRRGYRFPYLYDQTQEIAKLYQAACTPDFFLFDEDRRLAYRGQFDSSRPKNDEPVNGADMRAAVEAVLGGQSPTANQIASIGCNIKWKPGNEPEYFG
ncbi:MAG: alkyl hydroperoxide reductase [Thiotrichales bacterium SG8_50]|nr:MAG: alkyl hydroperoxide reductase [Thiotrichales bacterium SG8_50]